MNARIPSLWIVACVGAAGTLLAAAGSPWTAYNAAVEAYAAGDFATAERTWQELAYEPLPRGLRQPVWFQVGNAQFRLGEKLEDSTPEQTADYWRQSAQAYRQVLQLNRGHASAQHNLALVEARLSRLAHRLGNELVERSEKQSLDEGIQSLRAAVDYLREATELAPRDAQVREDRDRAVARLQAKLLERAGGAEQRGDTSAAQDYREANVRAERDYREALADLNEASQAGPPPGGRSPPKATEAPANPEVASAQARVTEKLSQLLTRMGQREQKAGEQNSDWEPDEALRHFEQALEDFQAAQAEKPGNTAAQVGEAQVRAAMEKMLMREGKQALQAGKEALSYDAPTAVRELSSALGSFSGAFELNPMNTQAQAGAEEARRLLPPALNEVGQREQKAGERAEDQSPEAAIPHFQDAESAYERSLELKPGQPQAQAGLEQVRQKLERAREQLAQQMSQEKTPPSAGKPQTLEQLLGQLPENDRDRRQELDRERQRGRNEPQPRRGYPDW